MAKMKQEEPLTEEQQKRKDIIDYLMLRLKTDLINEGIAEAVIQESSTIKWLFQKAKKSFEALSTRNLQSLYDTV